MASVSQYRGPSDVGVSPPRNSLYFPTFTPSFSLGFSIILTAIQSGLYSLGQRPLRRMET